MTTCEARIGTVKLHLGVYDSSDYSLLRILSTDFLSINVEVPPGGLYLSAVAIYKLLPLFGYYQKCCTLTSKINFAEVNLPFKEDAYNRLSVCFKPFVRESLRQNPDLLQTEL